MSEKELELIVRKRLELEHLQKEFAGKKLELDVAEEHIKNRIKAGCHITGKLLVKIDLELGQCRPPWKEIYLRQFEEKHRTEAEIDAKAEFPAITFEVLNIFPKVGSS